MAALLYGSTNQRAGIPCGVAKSLRGRTRGGFRPLAQLRVPVGDLATLQSGNAGIKVVLCMCMNVCVCVIVSVYLFVWLCEFDCLFVCLYVCLSFILDTDRYKLKKIVDRTEYEFSLVKMRRLAEAVEYCHFYSFNQVKSWSFHVDELTVMKKI